MMTKTGKKNAKPKARAKPVKAMTMPKIGQPALATPYTQEQMLEVCRLVKGATSVELKLSVPAAGHRATTEGIGFDPVEAEPRQAFFFDTPDLALSRAGVVVRARRLPGGDADTVVKLRPVNPFTIDPELCRSAAFKIEVDAMPGGFVCSTSFKGVCTGQEVLDATAGALPLRKLFSREQRAFYDAHAPAGVTMDQLVVLGPTFLLKVKHQPKDFDRRIRSRCGSIRMARASWKSPPNACRKRPSRSPLSSRPTSPTTASHSAPISLQRPRLRWSSSAPGSRRRRCPAERSREGLGESAARRHVRFIVG